jgi:flagellar secretion chaperone FliS
MNRTNPYSKYRQVATTTASPGQLVLMLYDGTIRFLEQALDGFSKEDPSEFNASIGNNVLRAQAILDELTQALDVRAGGEFALTLHRLYLYFDRRLTESNVRKEPEGIREVIRRVSTLRDAWKEMLAQGGAQTAPEDMPLVETAL